MNPPATHPTTSDIFAFSSGIFFGFLCSFCLRLLFRRFGWDNKRPTRARANAWSEWGMLREANERLREAREVIEWANEVVIEVKEVTKEVRAIIEMALWIARREGEGRIEVREEWEWPESLKKAGLLAEEEEEVERIEEKGRSEGGGIGAGGGEEPDMAGREEGMEGVRENDGHRKTE